MVRGRTAPPGLIAMYTEPHIELEQCNSSLHLSGTFYPKIRLLKYSCNDKAHARRKSAHASIALTGPAACENKRQFIYRKSAAAPLASIFPSAHDVGG